MLYASWWSTLTRCRIDDSCRLNGLDQSVNRLKRIPHHREWSTRPTIPSGRTAATRSSGPSRNVSFDERVLGLVFGAGFAAVVAAEVDTGHCSVHVDLGSKRPTAGRVEQAGHELVAPGLAAILYIVEPQMRATARAERALGEGGRAVARDLARDGDRGGVGVEAQEQSP